MIKMSFDETMELVDRCASMDGFFAYGNYLKSDEYGDLTYLGSLLPVYIECWSGSGHGNEVVKGFIDGALTYNDIASAEYAIRFLE